MGNARIFTSSKHTHRHTHINTCIMKRIDLSLPAVLLTFFLLLAASAAFGQQPATCAARTQAGHMCTRKAVKTGLCTQHYKMLLGKQQGLTSSKAAAVTCGGKTKAGNACRNRTTHASGKCHLHRS